MRALLVFTSTTSATGRRGSIGKSTIGRSAADLEWCCGRSRWWIVSRRCRRQGMSRGIWSCSRRKDAGWISELLKSWPAKKRLVMICGRYEGVDHRAIDLLQPDEISIGDYILGGGEVAAMVVIDAVVRLMPGVLGDEESNRQDSFSGERPLLEFPQYTRPREYRGLKVPDVLMSGNHPDIARWREQQQLDRTRERRADLLGDDAASGVRMFEVHMSFVVLPQRSQRTQRSFRETSVSDRLTEKIIGAAIEVHRVFGPGFFRVRLRACTMP